MTPRVVGVAGYKNAGKTTLVERLVAELVRRGLAVCTVKHAHHSVQFDREGKDSWRHQQAGARAVAVVTAERWAVMRELRGAVEPPLAEVVATLPPCDVVLVEGYKSAAIPKIEVRDPALGHPELVDDHVVAVATAGPLPESAALPTYSRDDVEGLADLVVHLANRPG